MRTVLLVCGSRALDPSAGLEGDAASERWARERIDTRIAALPAGSLVLSGRCPFGPDAWAAVEARRRQTKLVEFDARGYRWDNSERTGTWWPRWYAAWRSTLYSQRPLARNEAMAAAAKHMADKGWAVQVVALVAPWTSTRGTEHMVSQARRRGLDTEVLRCERVATPVPLTLVRPPRLAAEPQPEAEPDEVVPPNSRVYFIQTVGGAIKIGVTTDMDARLASLQTASPEKLVVLGWCPGGYRLERALHRRFDRLRLEGEWFRPGRELLLMIHRLHHNAATRPKDAAEALRLVRVA